MNFRRGGLWLGGLVCAVTLGACVGSSSEVGSMNDGGGGQGNECEAGATKPAGDGCNTCTCGDDGSWACTLLDCGCEEGATRPAGDGCNECVCIASQWACSENVCEKCTLGEMRPTECGSCWCTDLGDGPTWACTANVCTECTEGETKPGENACSTCTCGPDGHWDCPVVPCPACQPGEMRAAGDGCNTCTCMNGTWGCTMKQCDPLVCDDGFGDCNGDPADSCETSLATDVMNCGACGNYCNFAGALGACDNGQCAVGECQAGYADCNGETEDGCESPVGAGSCDGRCEVPTMVTEPVPAEGTCECPAGTVCVRGSLADEDPDSELCYPIPQGCSGGFASCDCMVDCACPADSATTCYDQMAIGGVFIINCPGYHP